LLGRCREGKKESSGKEDRESAAHEKDESSLA
jgi:hypothetical protein